MDISSELIRSLLSVFLVSTLGASTAELTRLHDQLAAERRDLPWERIEKNYLFDAPGGKVRLADPFDGRSQLAIYHFIFGPDWQEG